LALVGKVLWWDARDGKGVIEDTQGNEYYFDSSVLSEAKHSKIRSGCIIRFELNRAVRGTLCAHRVQLANPKEKAAAKKAFERQHNEAVL
jgi:cold shock CspA family protein